MEDLTVDARIPARLTYRAIDKVDGYLEAWTYPEGTPDCVASCQLSLSNLREVRAWFSVVHPFPKTLATFRHFTLHAPDGFEVAGTVYRVANPEEFLDQCFDVLGPFATQWSRAAREAPPADKADTDLQDFVRNAWDFEPDNAPTHLLLEEVNGAFALLKLEEIVAFAYVSGAPWWSAAAADAMGVAPPVRTEPVIRVTLRSGINFEGTKATWRWIP